MEWRKPSNASPEIVDELNYKCGDPATEKELQGSYFPNKNAAEFLDTLLQPIVVSSTLLQSSEIMSHKDIARTDNLKECSATYASCMQAVLLSMHASLCQVKSFAS